jgi:integrase
MKARQLPSGNYRVVLAVGVDEEGKRKYKSFTADEEWKALKMATDYQKEIQETTFQDITVDKAMNEYIANKANVIEPTTVRNYRYIAKYCFRNIANVKVSDLRTVDVQKAVNAERERISAKYTKNAYAFLKSVLVMYNANVNFQSIKVPKLPKPTQKELPSFERVFSIVKGTESELPVLLAAWLSLRIGEVIGLQFRDIDPKNKTLLVRRTIIYTEDGAKVRDGCKTESSIRELQVPTYILNLINQIPYASPTDFIIPKSRRAVCAKFTRLMAKNNIKISFHDLRHLNASIMLMLGIPDKYAMERGSWSTDYVLKSVYQQTFSSERLKVDNVIDEYFNSIVNKEL